jgi:hypothetical protein
MTLLTRRRGRGPRPLILRRRLRSRLRPRRCPRLRLGRRRCRQLSGRHAAFSTSRGTHRTCGTAEPRLGNSYFVGVGLGSCHTCVPKNNKFKCTICRDATDLEVRRSDMNTEYFQAFLDPRHRPTASFQAFASWCRADGRREVPGLWR